MTERRLRVLAILTENTLWKKRIAEELGETPATIGWDVQPLQSDGLLAPEFVAPENESRHHFITYSTTEEGEKVLDDYFACKHCGEVVDSRRDCLHDYAPLSEMESIGVDF